MKLTQEQLEAIYNQEYDSVPEFKDWELSFDKSTGTFDSEKGFMYDFEIYLINPNGNTFQAEGGYYTGVTGIRFNSNTEFVETTNEEVLETYSLTDIEVRTIAAMIEMTRNLPVGAEALEGYEDLTSDEAWQGLDKLSQKF